MSTYMQYFFDHSGQFLSVVAVAVLWLGLAALGGAISGVGRMRALDPLVGWAWVGFVFTAAGVFLAIPFTYLAVVTAVIAAGAGFWVWRRDGGVVPGVFLRMLVLTIPLLILVSAMRASQWDEFSDWMIIPRYMLETDAFPSKDNSYPNAVYTGYPYSWHFVTYLASRIAGGLLENAGALVNVFLLLMFGLVVIQLISRGAERPELMERSGWFAASLGAAAMLLTNPTFSQKIVLTSYAETASAVATGAGVVLGWLICEALVDNERRTARRYAWQMGAVLALLINLKQATMVLVVLIVLAILFMAIRDRRIPVVMFVKLLPQIVLPAVILYLVWRYHVLNELVAREIVIRPFDDWYIDLIPHILMKMGVALAKKGYYLSLLIIAVGFGLRGFFRAAGPVDRFAAICAMVILGYNTFLLFAYVTTFGKFDALRVASFWRYNMHLGPMLIAFSAYGAAIVWRRHLAARWNWQRAQWLPIVLLLAAPFVFAKKIRFDTAPMTVHFRAVGAALPALLTPADQYFVSDPTGSGESAVILRYELDRGAKFGGVVSAFDPHRLKTLERVLPNPKLNAMIVFSMDKGFAERIGRNFPPGSTYLVRRVGLGPWEDVMSWPQPAVK